MWIPILSATVGAIVGAVATQSLNHILRKRRKKVQDIDQWYEQAVSLISHGRGICLSRRRRSNLQYGDISEESRKIANRLNEHINPHPDEVNKETIRKIWGLWQVFSKLAEVTEATEDQSTNDAIEEIFEMGQREYESKEDDFEMAEAVNQSTEYSSTMGQIVDQSEIDPRIFGSQLGDELGHAESFEQLLTSMGENFKDNQKAFEKAIERDILSDDWDDSLSVGVRIHLQITTNLCEEAINEITEINSLQTAN